MIELTVEILEELTDLVDEYNDQPIWKEQITDLNKDILYKDVKLGGSKLYQGDMIRYGNYALCVGKKRIEFVVYDSYDSDIMLNTVNM